MYLALQFRQLTRLAAGILFGGLVLVGPAELRAQGGPGGRGFMQDGQQRVEALRTAFITTELKLTSDEAKVFWPVYEAREAELKKARRDQAVDRFEARLGFESMSEAELDQLMDKMMGYQQQEVDIHKKYHGEFKKVLGIRRTAMLYQAEQKFKRELLRRVREGAGDRPGKF